MAATGQRTAGGMTPIPREDIQPLLLDMLKAFDAYCEQHGIEYFLACGSAIGAVRHAGFIPWDDDADVALLWDMYNKLMRTARQHPCLDDAQRYKILLPLEGESIFPYVKVVDTRTVVYERNIDTKYATGLWLDVFCMAGYPADDAEVRRMCAKSRRLKVLNKIMVLGNVYDAKFRYPYPIYALVRAVLRLGGKDDLRFARAMAAMDEAAPRDSGFVGDVDWVAAPSKKYPAEYFASTVRVEFEDTQLPVPIKCHEYLTQLYGDYLALPPKHLRKPHAYDAYYL